MKRDVLSCERGQPRLELDEQNGLLLIQQLQRGDLLDQLLVPVGGFGIERGVVVGGNSQRYARRSPRWRTLPLWDLTSYMRTSA